MGDYVVVFECSECVGSLGLLFTVRQHIVYGRNVLFGHFEIPFLNQLYNLPAHA